MEISLEDFREEMAERLREWEHCVLDFEQSPDDSIVVNNLFRVVHTVKGVAGTCGYNGIVTLTHELESYLDGVRRKSYPVASGVVDTMLQAGDVIQQMVSDLPQSTAFKDSTRQLVEMIKQLLPAQNDESSFPAKEESSLPQRSTFPLRYLRYDTIDQFREELRACLRDHTNYSLDLSEVRECDAEGVHFVCSLVPLFIRSGIALTVHGISDIVVAKAFELGIDIRNVLKRASVGTVDPQRGRMAQFTITLYQEESNQASADLTETLDQLRSYLLQSGTVAEQCSLSNETRKSCTILVSTTASRIELERYLDSLPEEILWTISLTPDQNQKRDVMRRVGSEPTIKDFKRLLLRWEDRLNRICELIETRGDESQRYVLGEFREIQSKMRKAAPDPSELPLSVFIDLLRMIRE